MGEHLPRRRRSSTVRRREESGFGRERGEAGLLEFLTTKNVMIDYSEGSSAPLCGSDLGRPVKGLAGNRQNAARLCSANNGY